MKTDSFGDRMKAHEAAEAQRVLPADRPVLVRIDGRRFSRFTRGFAKPFDPALSGAMRETCRLLVEETGARIGYVQSDEISLVLFRRHEGDALPFSGRPQKIVSTCASLATALFIRALHRSHPERALAGLPSFDARAWSVPDAMEAVNAVIWRIQDAGKNGISAACRSVASPSEMQGLSGARMIALMRDRGVDFEADFSEADRLGVLHQRRSRLTRIDDATWARIPSRSRPESREVIRTAVVELPARDLLDAADKVAFVFGDDLESGATASWWIRGRVRAPAAETATSSDPRRRARGRGARSFDDDTRRSDPPPRPPPSGSP
jgi:tRNA(His) guanylyltransferase